MTLRSLTPEASASANFAICPRVAVSTLFRFPRPMGIDVPFVDVLKAI
jgi:hypothetical protein